jgi:hypothetical protein
MIRELIDTELETVAGGNGLSVDFISQYANLSNDSHQNAFAFGPGATAVNALGVQSNSSSQVAAIIK